VFEEERGRAIVSKRGKERKRRSGKVCEKERE
jgi:hypothetical protein